MGPIKTIRIMCPNLKCRSILVVPETARGKNVKCSNCGTLFKINTAGTLTPLQSGGNPRSGFIQGNDGFFYGTTTSGGAGSRRPTSAARPWVSRRSHVGPEGGEPSDGEEEGKEEERKATEGNEGAEAALATPPLSRTIAEERG